MKKALCNITIPHRRESRMHDNVRRVEMKEQLILSKKKRTRQDERLQILLQTALTPSGIHLRIKRFNLEMLGNSFSPK